MDHFIEDLNEDDVEAPEDRQTACDIGNPMLSDISAMCP